MKHAPGIKLLGLDLQGLKCIDRLRWPQDVGAWASGVPDVAVIAGENGSGKTTLLEFIAAAASCMTARAWSSALNPGFDSWIEFRVSGEPAGHECVRFLAGSPEFLRANRQIPSYGVATNTSAPRLTVLDQSDWIKAVRRLFPSKTPREGLPSVVYFPSDRALRIPASMYRAAGKLTRPATFYHRWEPPKIWRDSLEAELYAARWEDLNALAAGQEARHFERYVTAFEAVTRGEKSLVWEDAELFVRLQATGEIHGLAGLSSGEKQMLIFSAELRRWWRPGSLILIDEPELHLHPSWQVRLLETLTAWQAELGGQVLLTTLSEHIYEAAAPASRATLAPRTSGAS